MEMPKDKVPDIPSFSISEVSFTSNSNSNGNTRASVNYIKKQDPASNYLKFHLDDIKLPTNESQHDAAFNNRILTREDSGLSDKIVTKLVKLESESRSKNSRTQIEAILGFNKLLDDFPFPVVANSAFLKLADLFRYGTNNARLYILKVFECAKKHLFLIQNADELIKRLLVVLDSNDPVARSLTLKLLGSASVIFSSSLEVQYKLLQRYDTTNNLELVAVIETTESMLRYNPSYLRTVWHSLIQKLSIQDIPSNIKAKIALCTRHSRGYPSKTRWAIDWCRSFVISQLQSVLNYSHSCVIDYTFFEKKKMVDDELFLASILTWESMLDSRDETLSAHDISVLLVVLATGSKTCRYLALSALSKGLLSVRANSINSEKKDIHAATLSITHQVNSLVLMQNNLNYKTSRKEVHQALKVLIKCSELLGFEETSLESIFAWILLGTGLSFSDLEKALFFSDLEEPINMNHVKSFFPAHSSVKLQIWKIYSYLVIIKPILENQSVAKQKTLLKPESYQLIKSTVATLACFGFQLLFMIVSNTKQTEPQSRISKTWISKFIKVSTKTVASFKDKDSFISLSKHIIKCLSVENKTLQYYSVIALECMALSYPSLFLEQIHPLLSRKFNTDVEMESTESGVLVQNQSNQNTVDRSYWCLLLFYLKVAKNIKNRSTPSPSAVRLFEIADGYVSSFSAKAQIEFDSYGLSVLNQFGSEAVWWLIVESCSAGSWLIVSAISRQISKNKLSPLSNVWWEAMSELSLSQVEQSETLALSQSWFQSAVSKFRLIYQSNENRRFQFELLTFHSEALTLLFSFNKLSSSKPTYGEIVDLQKGIPDLNEAPMRLQILGNAGRILEKCKQIQFSQIYIDKVTLKLLKSWETIALDILLQLERPGYETCENRVLHPPTLCLGHIFTKAAPNISLEIDTSPEIPEHFSTLHTRTKWRSNLGVIKDESYNINRSSNLGLNIPAGSQFFVQVLGLVSRPNSSYDMSASGIKSGSPKIKFVSSIASSNNNAHASIINGFEYYKSSPTLPISFTSFKADVWLSTSSDAAFPKFMILPNLKNLVEKHEQKPNSHSTALAEITNYFSMGGCISNDYGNLINESVPWNEYMNLPKTFLAPIKSDYFDCTVSVQLPPSSLFYSIYKPTYYPDTQDYRVSRNNKISLGQKDKSFKAQVYMHIYCSVIDKFDNVWYLGPHLVFPLLLY